MSELVLEPEQIQASQGGRDPVLPNGPELTAKQRKKIGYLPTLDGWRTIAVGGVILYHSRLDHIGPVDISWLQAFGERGVQLFFAISGLLICSRLLEELRSHGDISLKGFYLRRLFRIQPAAWMYLAFLGLLALAGVLHPSLRATMSAVFCYRNYFLVSNAPALPDDRYTVHFWSLAVEEHFYLLLPALLLFTRKYAERALFVLSVLFLLWTPLAHRIGLAASDASLKRTDLSLRDLLVPALLAILLAQRPAVRSWMERISRYSLPLIVTAVLIGISERFLGGHPTSTITCLFFPLVVASTMLHPTGVVGRFLESRPMTYVGRISYSLYLWQQLFFARRDTHSLLSPLQNGPWNLLAALGCAIASYYLLEKPMMRLGHRLAPPVTPGRPDLAGTPTS